MGEQLQANDKQLDHAHPAEVADVTTTQTDQTAVVSIVIPPGAFPGQLLNIQHNGRTYQISCPQGALPGETIQAKLDDTATVSTALAPTFTQSDVEHANIPVRMDETLELEKAFLSGLAKCILPLAVINFFLAWGSPIGIPFFFIGMIINIIACILDCAIPNASNNKLGPTFRCGVAAAVFAFLGTLFCLFDMRLQIYCANADVYYNDIWGFGFRMLDHEYYYEAMRLCIAMWYFNLTSVIVGIIQCFLRIMFVAKLQMLRFKLGNRSPCC